MTLKKKAQSIKRVLLKRKVKKKRKRKPHRRDLLSTGSTLLNLSLSDNPHGGFLKGKYYFLVGDSMGGKTFLSMTCLGEAICSKYFKDYRLIYDNIEDGMLMDVVRLWGRNLKRKIEPPARAEDGSPVYSSTVEEFYYHLDDALGQGEPFIYVLDSEDALDSEDDEEHFEAMKKAHRGEGKEVGGTYGTAKAKAHSTTMRRFITRISTARSILIVVSQTRQNVKGFGFQKKTRSGGEALRFYATAEMWATPIGDVKKQVRDKPRKIGTKIKITMRKNRITGKLRDVEELRIYPSYGIDDIGSCVDYLVSEKWWKKRKNTILAKDLGIEATREKLISRIEEEDLEEKLREIVGKCWAEIEKACELQRKKRYQ